MRPRRVAAACVAAALAIGAADGCARKHAAAPAAASAPVATAQPTPSGTPVPIRIETQGGAGQYVTIVQTLHGRKLYTIRALSTDVQSAGTNEGTGVLDQPHVTFVDRTGTSTIADAPKAHLIERDKTVVMTGGVHAHTSTGSVLTCDTLTYNGTSERFHGEGHVELASADGMHLSGQHLDGDTRLQEVVVSGGGS